MWGKLISLNPDTYPDVELSTKLVWLGRDKDCHQHARFTDPTISKKHCCVTPGDSPNIALVDDTSSNGTFVDGTLVGKGNRAELKDGGIISLVVTGPEHKNYTSSSVAYTFLAVGSGTAATPDLLDEGKVESIISDAKGVSQRLTDLVKAFKEYEEAGANLAAKADRVVQLLRQGDKDKSCGDMIDAFARLERMKEDLHEKSAETMRKPLASFLEDDIVKSIDMASNLKPTKKKHDELQKKLSKETDPFKMKQAEQKFVEVSKELELANMTVASKLQNIESMTSSNIKNAIVAYNMENLGYHRKGHEYLSKMEKEMSTKKQEISLEVEQQYAQHQQGIDRLKQLQSRANPRLAKEKQGYLLRGKKPLWFVVIDGVVSYYKSWKESAPLGSYDLLLTSVKPNTDPKKKLSFDLTHPEDSMQLQAMNKEDFDEWLTVFKNAILAQLETHKKMKDGPRAKQYEATISQATISMTNMSALPPLAQVTLMSRGNTACADCNAKDPDWVSINHGCVICYECSGVHRSLGTHISKVRSLTLDKWEPQLLQLVKLLGNENANKVLESAIGSTPKLLPTADRAAREEFINAKYVEKKFTDKGEFTPTQASKRLYTVATEIGQDEKMLLAMVALLASGADVNWVNIAENKTTALHYAVAAGKTPAQELLMQSEACLDAKDSRGWTPLHYAASCNQPGAARMLIQRGANASIKDADGHTPLDVAKANDSKHVRMLLEGTA